MMQILPPVKIGTFSPLYLTDATDHIFRPEFAAQENILFMDKTVTHILKRPEKLVMPLLYILSIKRIGFVKLHQIGNGNVARFGKNSRTYRIKDTISLCCLYFHKP